MASSSFADMQDQFREDVARELSIDKEQVRPTRSMPGPDREQARPGQGARFSASCLDMEHPSRAWILPLSAALPLHQIHLPSVRCFDAAMLARASSSP